MPSRVLAWKCDYCNKVTISAGSTAAHEAFCKKNPKNRYCKTCAKCYSKTVCDNSDGEFQFKQEIVWCKQFDKPIYEKPYYDDCQMQEEDYGSESYPIPCTCVEYESKEWRGQPQEGEGEMKQRIVGIDKVISAKELVKVIEALKQEGEHVAHISFSSAHELYHSAIVIYEQDGGAE